MRHVSSFGGTEGIHDHQGPAQIGDWAAGVRVQVPGLAPGELSELGRGGGQIRLRVFRMGVLGLSDLVK